MKYLFKVKQTTLEQKMQDIKLVEERQVPITLNAENQDMFMNY